MYVVLTLPLFLLLFKSMNFLGIHGTVYGCFEFDCSVSIQM